MHTDAIQASKETKQKFRGTAKMFDNIIFIPHVANSIVREILS